jgi:hypothetical protein
MPRIFVKFVISLSAFVLGVTGAGAMDFRAVLFISLLFLVGVPLFIVGIVVYQAVFLKYEWKPFAGKGFHSLLLWFFPSFFIAFVNLIFWPERPARNLPYHGEPTVVGFLFLTLLVLIYGAAGIGLCLWVKRPKIRDHWLLRNK